MFFLDSWVGRRLEAAMPMPPPFSLKFVSSIAHILVKVNGSKHFRRSLKAFLYY